ncbi:TPA: amino acid permease [Neisseria meningitidis]
MNNMFAAKLSKLVYTASDHPDSLSEMEEFDRLILLIRKLYQILDGQHILSAGSGGGFTVTAESVSAACPELEGRYLELVRRTATSFGFVQVQEYPAGGQEETQAVPDAASDHSVRKPIKINIEAKVERYPAYRPTAALKVTRRRFFRLQNR